MKVFKSGRSKTNVKKGISQLLIVFLLINTLIVLGSPSPALANTLTPPTLADVSASITKWANQYNIPPVVLKAAAWAESDWQQFENGNPLTPLIGYDGVGIGIMQISNYALGVTTDRLDGTDRFETAIKIANQFVSPTTAILAPAANANLVDALAAAPLAGKDSPILLTDNKALTEATKAELMKLKVTKVYVVGAIDTAVVEQVKAISGITEVIPIKGANRIATAAMISSKLTNIAGSFVVGYDALADALSVASYAAAHNYSIIVTNPDGTLPATQTLPSKAYIIGGPDRVASITGVTRLAGVDRYATNKEVLEKLDYFNNKAYVANGTDAHLVDALAASSLAAKSGAPIVLMDTDGNGKASAAYIGAKLANNAVVVALGGEDVVTASSVAAVTATAPTTRTAAQLDYINKLKTDYDFNISEGARILNQKWRTVPKIGDGDRNKLENWYFAVWAYNGWSTKNNPNYAKSQGLIAYQDKVFAFMGKKYNSTITQTYPTTIQDPSMLPQAPVDQSLPPNWSPSYLSTWATPTPYHLGDLVINSALLLSGGGSAAEPANGDYWLKFHLEHPTAPTAIYSLGYYVTGYNATTGTDKNTFAIKLISAAKLVTDYGTSRLNSAQTMEDVQVARKWLWAVLQIPNLDSATWQKAQDGYTQALQKTFP